MESRQPREYQRICVECTAEFQRISGEVREERDRARERGLGRVAELIGQIQELERKKLGLVRTAFLFF